MPVVAQAEHHPPTTTTTTTNPTTPTRPKARHTHSAPSTHNPRPTHSSPYEPTDQTDPQPPTNPLYYFLHGPCATVKRLGTTQRQTRVPQPREISAEITAGAATEGNDPSSNQLTCSYNDLRQRQRLLSVTESTLHSHGMAPARLPCETRPVPLLQMTSCWLAPLPVQ